MGIWVFSFEYSMGLDFFYCEGWVESLGRGYDVLKYELLMCYCFEAFVVKL